MIASMRRAWERGRFAVWVVWLRIRLRRVGARLDLDAPHGARLMGPPRLRLQSTGVGTGTFTLRVGRDVRIGPDLVLDLSADGTNELALGDGTSIRDWAVIELRSGSISVADRVQLRSWTVLKSSGELSLGTRAVVSYHAAIHCSERVSVADRVVVAERCTLVDSDHPHDGGDRFFYDEPIMSTPIEIGANTFIATGAVIARGARVGASSVVAAGAVVTAGSYRDGWLLAGLPAVEVRSLRGPDSSSRSHASGRTMRR